ncbi:odr-4-like protein [Oryzias melastigma]|uniref:Protein odr-4 homolog n=1 Tax=Oryzias melastigma TaxID=30732 RepID=A0A834CIW2_ORYME|nr:protein odr-4 homolog [Oryzias melastigma]XP_024130232.1 protein odr-4 homolog [Oryzias melastigma]XP_024130233.1 protein odr-4 homolog [Oryzias melastigma]KAF6727680.1 odr-4-like protein [Oryzias melastigma]
MGRVYIVDEDVEEYLSKLCSQQAGPVTGLLIGQSSGQRDFVVIAAPTPKDEESAGKTVDKEWVSEHARQVSRMLLGGLTVLGVFMITDADAKDTITTLRQLVFAVENLISSEQKWSPAEDDVTDCVTLHVNPKTRKTVCRTFDIKDPKSAAKPADLKYQSGVGSCWTTVSCWLNVDLLIPLPDSRASKENSQKGLQEGLKVWTRQIENAVCLIDGKKLPEDSELTSGQKRNVRQTYTAQLLTTGEEQRSADVVQPCGGSVTVRGAVHCRAFLHTHKPKVKLAEKLLKRDAISTVATRVQMLLDEPLASEEQIKDARGNKQQTEEFCLPRRIFCPLKSSGSLYVCDYQFSDEGLSEIVDRLKEMLGVDTAEEDLDTTQEMTAEITQGSAPTEPPVENNEELKPKSNNYMGAFMAAAAALLATAASMMYYSDM